MPMLVCGSRVASAVFCGMDKHTHKWLRPAAPKCLRRNGCPSVWRIGGACVQGDFVVPSSRGDIDLDDPFNQLLHSKVGVAHYLCCREGTARESWDVLGECS